MTHFAMSHEFCQSLESGIALFNQQKFFEAYELWQQAWEVEEGDAGDLLQGLLQLAFACHKLSLDEPQGVLKLLEHAEAKLMTYAPEAYDLDIAALLSLIQEWKGRAQEKVIQRDTVH